MYQKCEVKKMFPIKQKIHPMKKRTENKFKVQHANTERLKKSAIIYMQNLLNQNEMEKILQHS